MGTKKMICMAMMLFGLCIGAMAQKSIDKVVEDMERDADARITSIKKRDPETRKVVKVTKTIRLTSDEFAKRASYAFEKEEENALTSIKEKRSRVEYTLTFQSKVEKRTYILNIREGNDVEISVFITPAKEGDTSWISKNEIKRQFTEVDMERMKRNLDINMERMTKEMALVDWKQIDGQLNQLEGLSDKVQKEVQDRLKYNNIEVEADEIYVDGKRIEGDTEIVDD